MKISNNSNSKIVDFFPQRKALAVVEKPKIIVAIALITFATLAACLTLRVCLRWYFAYKTKNEDSSKSSEQLINGKNDHPLEGMTPKPTSPTPNSAQEELNNNSLTA